ncbi:hypothetical protein F5Y18DRAFT_428303 [Xylariaceae sp. FL1019]|nr:hypothetical protein F5Y18DRAFT_428303 [Xylariaceae sp. FL1019]
MAEEVDRLVLAPFREIVEKGKTAIENAQSAGDNAPTDMLKAAQNLVKEGEKALKRIEPVSTAHYEEYGGNFIDAVKENAQITQFRSELKELLWDFDDYVEVDEFDVEKYDELKKASRTAAPQMLDILTRMRLLNPRPISISSQIPILEAIRTPSLGHVSPVAYEQPTSMIDHSNSESVERLIERIDERLDDIIGPGSNTEAGTGDVRRSENIESLDSRYSRPSDPPSQPPPSPPSANPWQVGRIPMNIANNFPDKRSDYEARPPVTPDSPTIPSTQLLTHVEGVSKPLPAEGSRTRGSESWTHEEQDRRMRAASQSQGTEGSLSPLQSHRWTNSTQNSVESTQRPASRAYSGQGRPSRAASQSQDSSNTSGQLSANRKLTIDPGYPPRTTSVANQASSSYVLSSRKPSTESINSSVFDVVEAMSTSPVASGQRQSLQSTMSSSTSTQSRAGPPPQYSGYSGLPPLYQTPTIPPRRPSGITIKSQSSTRTAHPAFMNMGMDEGLIPVDMEDTLMNESPMPPRDPDCAITPSSSFCKLKGFCQGAEEARKGQLGFKKIKRPVGGFSTAVVAKCTHCLFELDFKAVENDLNNDSSGNFTSNSVGFRLRILQKCHLPIRNVEEQMYACMFCVQQGHTNEESDATVFFNQKQLFAHIARHPRPLPKVSGVTVIEGGSVPVSLRDNFDIWLAHPPTESVMIGIWREIARLPSAIATDTRKMQNGVLRLPPDRQAVMHFAIGARIVGIEFPAKYEGKWAIGWHDGVRAAFETDSVQLDAPPKSQVRMQGTSNVQAVARWRWNQKGDDRWLKFDKGDIIKNISWTYTDHWCYSGATAKGPGIFPQSHIDPTSLRLMQPGDAASVASGEKKNINNLLKFSIRGKNTTASK